MRAGFIDGRHVDGEGREFTVDDPSYGREIARLRGLSEDQVDAAIRSARTAFDDGRWSGLSSQERAARLRRFVAALASHAEETMKTLLLETGCPFASPVANALFRVPMSQANPIVDLFLTLPDYEENQLPLSDRVSAHGMIQSLKRYTPIGVVAAIAAYNMPFLTALWKVIPALVTGNTVILRPSPFTPLSAMAFADAATDAGLPPGVLNVVIEGGQEGGQLLTTHPMVDMVAFTGSSRVGALVMAQAAPTMKRLQLELGGKSAQIFLPDSLDKVVGAAVGMVTSNAGQACVAGSRIFVPEENKADVLAEVKTALEKVRIGRGDDPEAQMGPVISEAQVQRCELFVKQAVQAGGTVVAGGDRPAGLDGGFYFAPTALDVADNANPAAQEEIFGPVVCIIGYRDLDHAVEMANDSRYGLSGYVFGKDRKRALDVALRIKSGTVNVNGALMSVHASSGGQRMSGIARERGIEGLRLYQQLSVLNLGA